MGVEEELLLVDPDSGAPLGRAGEVLDSDAGADLDGEMRPEQVETGSTPHSGVAALAADLRARRRDAAAAAAAQGATVAALATSPVPPGPATPPSGRYGEIHDRFGAVASAQLTNGQHVHVEVGSRDEGVGVLDRIGVWLPTLRALSANSPFWRGEDTGYASYRSVVWTRWPSAGPTASLGSVAAYDALVAAMLATGAPLDEAMVYFDARLAEHFPTVEIRVADVGATVDDAVLVAVLVRALVATAARAWNAGEPAPTVPVEVLRLMHWRAARSGLGGALVDPRTGREAPAADVLDALREHVGDALAETSDTDLVERGCADVLAGTTGAARQRAVFAEEGLRGVVLDAVGRGGSEGSEGSEGSGGSEGSEGSHTTRT